jgi:indole-3-glycerol phosphate synthase
MTIWDRIVEAKRQDMEARKRALPVVGVARLLKQLSHRVVGTAAHPHGPQLIAWIRKAFPCAGVMGDSFDPSRRIDERVRIGGQAQ